MSVNIRIEISILKFFILTVLLIKFGHCDEYMPERDYTENLSLLRFLRNGKLNPEKAFHLMETNLELRKSLDKIMNQRRKQLAYESFWELRRG